jgi:hypothetical protein
LQDGQTSGGLISTTVLPQLLHFQVFSGTGVLFSVIAVFPPSETTIPKAKWDNFNEIHVANECS